MMFVRLFLLPVSISICGCFSAPSEPDWVELSEVLMTGDPDVADGIVDSNRSVSTPDTLKTDVELTSSAVESTDDVMAGFDSEVDGSEAHSATDSDTESQPGDGSDTADNPQECIYEEGLIACELIGETQCVEGQPNKQEKCVAGDGCPYWSDQFCEANKTCQDGACQCEVVCPADGTCGQPDGCNGICECGDDQLCEAGMCVCAPDCPVGESTCGQSDGCGGTCPDVCIPDPSSGIELDGCTTKLECLSFPGTKKCEEIPVQDGEACLVDGQEGVCVQGLCDPDAP